MKVQIIVEFDTETRLLKLGGKGDPLLAVTALDMAHAKLLKKLDAEPRLVLESTDA